MTLPYCVREHRHLLIIFAVTLLALLLTENVLARSIQVTDDEDRIVTLDQPAKRVISLSPHATELMFEVQAGARVVGASEFSDYPDAARQIPRVGDSFSLNVEKILSLTPDLILAQRISNIEAQLETLANQGIPIYYTDPQSFSAIEQTQRNLGLLVGQQEAGEAAAMAFRKGMEELAARYGDQSTVSVFYQVWHDPLFTLSDRNFMGDVIAVCGARNIFAEATMPSPQVGLESVVSANPDVIIAGASNRSGLIIWDDMTELSAVANGHLYTVDPDLTARPTSSLLAGAEAVCGAVSKAR